MKTDTSTQQPPTPVRMPDDLKAQLKAEALANNRSLNGEIVTRLQSTFKSKRSPFTQQKGPRQ